MGLGGTLPDVRRAWAILPIGRTAMAGVRFDLVDRELRLTASLSVCDAATALYISVVVVLSWSSVCSSRCMIWAATVERFSAISSFPLTNSCR